MNIRAGFLLPQNLSVNIREGTPDKGTPESSPVSIPWYQPGHHIRNTSTLKRCCSESLCRIWGICFLLRSSISVPSFVNVIHGQAHRMNLPSYRGIEFGDLQLDDVDLRVPVKDGIHDPSPNMFQQL